MRRRAASLGPGTVATVDSEGLLTTVVKPSAKRPRGQPVASSQLTFEDPSAAFASTSRASSSVPRTADLQMGSKQLRGTTRATFLAAKSALAARRSKAREKMPKAKEKTYLQTAAVQAPTLRTYAETIDKFTAFAGSDIPSHDAAQMGPLLASYLDELYFQGEQLAL